MFSVAISSWCKARISVSCKVLQSDDLQAELYWVLQLIVPKPQPFARRTVSHRSLTLETRILFQCNPRANSFSLSSPNFGFLLSVSSTFVPYSVTICHECCIYNAWTAFLLTHWGNLIFICVIGFWWKQINHLKTKRNLIYIRNQFVPRSKHFPPRL